MRKCTLWAQYAVRPNKHDIGFPADIRSSLNQNKLASIIQP
jgi:hypothetical protein